MKNLSLRAWTFPFALLLAGVICYGLLIPRLGFYWDDWPTVWFYHLLGPAGFIDVFAVDRPLLGVLYRLFSPLAGESALAWQLFCLVTRWLSCLAVWWSLLGLWPERRQLAGWTALLFAVYPGFKQQPIAVTYSITWITLSLFMLSLGLMIWAQRKPRWFWPLMTASWLISAFVMFTDEYYFGLELLRPVLLWLLDSEQGASLGRRAGRVILRWAPFVLNMAAFLVFRLALSSTPRGQVTLFSRLHQNPLTAIALLVNTILQDIFETGALAWVQGLNLRESLSLGSIPLLISAAVALAAAVIFTFYLAYLDRSRRVPENTPDLGTHMSHQWGWQALGLGLFALLVGGWPFWATDLPIKLHFPNDRFTLSMMLGASLLLAGIVELLSVRRRWLSAALIGLVIGLSAGAHYQNTVTYRRDWEIQKSFFWQLAWRIPGLKPGTAILTANLPFKYYTDNSLSGPLNWLYAPDLRSRQMPYLLVDIPVRLGLSLPSLEPGQPITQPYRAARFDGSTSQAVVIDFTPPGCLKVVDPTAAGRQPVSSHQIDSARPLSNPGYILAAPQQPARPPVSIFGNEPAHAWCYYYEKADLARQDGNWQMVALLGDEAFRLRKAGQGQAVESLVYIEGYAHTEKWEPALRLTQQVFQASGKLQPALCATWKRIQQETGATPRQRQAVSQVSHDLQCALK